MKRIAYPRLTAVISAALVFFIVAASNLIAQHASSGGRSDGGSDSRPEGETDLTAEEIITRLEENRTYETSRAELTMVIRDRFGERESTMIAWSRGADEALIEFTSTAERGQKVLRTADEIYLYYPDAAELVRLQGAALRESMLGSDVSYEDLTGGKSILDTYDVEFVDTEEIDGYDTYEVTLEARRGNVAYPKQTMWIDTELFMTRRSEQYALSGRLLKTITFHDIEEIDGHSVPIRTVVSDALKRNSSTTVVIDDFEIGLSLSDDTFSLEELSW
ncbi:MAG: outer membrane lipoprotein-sorting protein [Alkalispirochaeta sp.]